MLPCSSYCGNLSRRPISTEEEEFSWDISSCLHESYKGFSSFKSPEFRFAEATWVLCTRFANDTVNFGIFLHTTSTSVEVLDCCFEISYRYLNGEVFKKFKLQFKYGEYMPLLGMNDFFKVKNSTQPNNIGGNAVIVCRLSAKKSTDITSSIDERAKNTIPLDYVVSVSCGFLTEDWKYCGKLTSKFISTEEQELTWDISSCVPYDRLIRGMCQDFSFGFGTWYLVASLDKTFITFGINVRKRCSSDEFVDCFCSISYQNFEGKVYQSFELKFKCHKSMPLISMRDCYRIPQHSSLYSRYQAGVLIVCRISSKKFIRTEACSSTESNAIEVRKSAHSPERKDDGDPIVNSTCKCCQDFRQLLQSGEGSDVILQVEDQPFKAHRAILIARSSVFASMFRHNMKEKETGVVNIEDCYASSFPVLLEFLYCGRTEGISQENVFGLYTSSDKYDLPDLKRKCHEFIKNNLSVETFCDAVRLSLRHSENELLKLAMNFFAGNFKDIIVTVKWQNFILENPVQANEILIKALASSSQD